MSAYENLTDPNTYITRGRPQSEPMFTESDWRPCNVPLLDRLKTILCHLFKCHITYFLFEIELWDLLSSYYCNCFSGNINWIWFILNKSIWLIPPFNSLLRIIGMIIYRTTYIPRVPRITAAEKTAYRPKNTDSLFALRTRNSNVRGGEARRHYTQK